MNEKKAKEFGKNETCNESLGWIWHEPGVDNLEKSGLDIYNLWNYML